MNELGTLSPAVRDAVKRHMARNGFVYFEGYQRELVSFCVYCAPKAHAPLAQKLSAPHPDLSGAHPLGGCTYCKTVSEHYDTDITIRKLI